MGDTLTPSHSPEYTYNFVSALILVAQNGFGQNVEHLIALSRETWGEHQWLNAVKNLPHGALKRKNMPGFNVFGVEDPEEVVDPFGKRRTRLMYAAKVGDVARLIWLLSRGARLELKDWEGNTALIWATEYGHLKVARELLLRGADVHVTNNLGQTPLYIASRYGHLEVAKELLLRGADINAADNDGYTPLYIAIYNNNLDVFNELLSKEEVDIEAATKSGWTPLYLAVWFKRVNVVRELRSRGANTAAQASDHSTPLSIAMERRTDKEYGEIIKLLQEKASEGGYYSSRRRRKQNTKRSKIFKIYR
jgi:ankyrin repeat protein